MHQIYNRFALQMNLGFHVSRWQTKTREARETTQNIHTHDSPKEPKTAGGNAFHNHGVSCVCLQEGFNSSFESIEPIYLTPCGGRYLFSGANICS